MENGSYWSAWLVAQTGAGRDERSDGGKGREATMGGFTKVISTSVPVLGGSYFVSKGIISFLIISTSSSSICNLPLAWN